MSDPPITIFISYAHADSAFVDQLEADLRKLGFETWVDRQRLAGGQRWRRELQEAVEQAHVLLIVLSPEAIASQNVQIEFDFALDLGKVVIPLYYHQANVPMELRAIQWIDFRHSYEEGLAALLRALGQQMKMARPAASAETRPAEGAQGPSQQPIEELAPVPAAPHQALAPLVGRQVEWPRLQQLWQQTAIGKAQLVVIAGETGVGKTRLAEELLAWVAQQQLSTARASCYAVESTLAYAPVSVWLHAPAVRSAVSGLSVVWLSEVARFVPEILVERPSVPPPGPLTESWQHQRLFEALARAILAARQPLLLLLDDLHWCDRETLNWLHYLLRFIPQARLLILATLRSEELTDEHPVQGLLTTLGREGLVTQINLEALTAAETASLATQTAGRELSPQVLSQLYQETEGNPLFVMETVRIGLEEPGAAGASRLAPTIQAVIGARLAQLSPEARELVNVAAVIGRPFSVELLVQASKRDEAAVMAALDEMWQRRILREEAQGYDFSHTKIREVAYAELRPPRRRLLHRQVAEALETLYAKRLEMVSGQLALHYERSGEWTKTLQYAQQAGEQAQRLYDPRAAIEQYTRALDAAQKGSLTPPPTIYRLRGQAYETLGEFEHALSDYETTLQMAREASDGQGEWQALIDLGFLWTGRDYTQAGTYFQQALALAEQLADDALRALSLNRLGNWLVNTGRIQEALEAYQEALGLFEMRADRQGMAQTLGELGMTHYFTGDPAGTVKDFFGRAIELFRTLGDSQNLFSYLAARAMDSAPETIESTYSALRTRDECVKDVQEALLLARQTNSQSGQALVEMATTLVLSSFGEFGPAFAHAQEALRIATAIEHQEWTTATYSALGQLYLLLLAPAQAISYLEAALAGAQALGSAIWVRGLTPYLALAYIHRQEFSRAEAALKTVLHREQQPGNFFERQAARVWGELALARGEAARALAIAEHLIASAPGDARPQPIPHLLALKGEALIALKRLEEAVEALEEAKLGAELRQAPSILWRIHRSLGRVYHLLQRDDQAQLEFTTTRHFIQELTTTIDETSLRERFLHTALDLLPQEKPRESAPKME